MRTIVALTLTFLLIFCVMLLVAHNGEPRIPDSELISVALQWTLHLLGGLVATISAVGMILVAAGHGSFQRQIVLAPPLLAGILLMNASWGAALAFGVIVAVWIYRYGGPEIEQPTKAKRSTD